MAYVEPNVRYFLINSRPAPFQRANDELMAHQVALRQDDNVAFLHHDSVLDCSRVLGGPTLSNLEDTYMKGGRLLVGRIGAKGRRAVRSVVQQSSLLSQREIDSILAMW